jgi:hypothetical protein
MRGYQAALYCDVHGDAREIRTRARKMVAFGRTSVAAGKSTTLRVNFTKASVRRPCAYAARRPSS